MRDGKDVRVEVPAQYGYAVVFGTVLGEQIGLPIPSEPVLIGAGGLVAAVVWI